MSKDYCSSCKKKFYSFESKWLISAYASDGVGLTKIFDTIEEASIYLQKIIHEYDNVTISKQFRMIE